MEVVIDTSVLVGLLVSNDHRHVQAVDLWNEIKAKGHTAIFLDCVAAETISVSIRRLEERGLSGEVDLILNQFKERVPDEYISWVLPDVPRLFSEIVELIRLSTGSLNFNDALIALACHERNIPAIASFDQDFDEVRWLNRLGIVENSKE